MLAIHHRPKSFSDKWIDYCNRYNIPFKEVNCYSSDIIEQIRNCDGLMWHWSHLDPKAKLFARQLTFSLEKMGKKVFPDSNTCWHYNDKVGQKYLLEAIGAPLVPSYVLYSKKEALKWIGKTTFPKVFKTRCGASSSNVVLVKNEKHAKLLIKKAFGKGFSPLNRFSLFKDRIWHIRRDRDLSSLIGLSKGFVRLFIPSSYEKKTNREKNYIYFQNYVPNNNFDIRVHVIGNRAVAVKRFVRKNDFRASGSGKIIYRKENINLGCIKTAFDLSKKIQSQCMGYDFVFEREKIFLLEISYAFPINFYFQCPGYWTPDLNWHEDEVIPEYFMIEEFLKSLNGQ